MEGVWVLEVGQVLKMKRGYNAVVVGALGEVVAVGLVGAVVEVLLEVFRLAALLVHMLE